MGVKRIEGLGFGGVVLEPRAQNMVHDQTGAPAIAVGDVVWLEERAEDIPPLMAAAE